MAGKWRGQENSEAWTPGVIKNTGAMAKKDIAEEEILSLEECNVH